MSNISSLIEERGIEKGRKEERLAALKRMISKNVTKKLILELEYTEEEYKKALAELGQMP